MNRNVLQQHQSGFPTRKWRMVKLGVASPDLSPETLVVMLARLRFWCYSAVDIHSLSVKTEEPVIAAVRVSLMYSKSELYNTLSWWMTCRYKSVVGAAKCPWRMNPHSTVWCQLKTLTQRSGASGEMSFDHHNKRPDHLSNTMDVSVAVTFQKRRVAVLDYILKRSHCCEILHTCNVQLR